MKSLSIVVLFAAACGSADALSASVEELSAALPQKAWVEMSPITGELPAEESLSCRTLGASQFGVLTHQIADNVSGVIGGVLDQVHAITMTPPAATAPGHAAWGPISSPTSAVYRLNVDASAPRQFNFLLEGRDAKRDWKGVFAGATITPDATHRSERSERADIAHRSDCSRSESAPADLGARCVTREKWLG